MTLQLDDQLLLLSPTRHEEQIVPLLQLLQQLAETLSQFLSNGNGGPLTSAQLTQNPDVILQLLNETCDGGLAHRSEADVLRETVEVPGWVERMLETVTLPGQAQAQLALSLKTAPAFALPPAVEHAFPWRRQNVRHTNNEILVDLVESLHVIVAPSGRPISARAEGLMTFTSQLSGVPDLTVKLAAPGGSLGGLSALSLPSFHPCVRLSRWKEKPGCLNFVPPDGRFVLAGYESDLLPSSEDMSSLTQRQLRLPVQLEVTTGLGKEENEFEIKLFFDQTFPSWSNPSSEKSTTGALTKAISSRFGQTSGGLHNSSSKLQLANVEVTIPLPSSVDKVAELRPSKGETEYAPGDDRITWLVPAQERIKGKTELIQSATLRCRIASMAEEEAVIDSQPAMTDIVAGFEEYIIEPEPELMIERSAVPPELRRKSRRSKTDKPRKKKRRPRDKAQIPADGPDSGARTPKSPAEPVSYGKKAQAQPPMPTAVLVSFEVRGWLASGLRVEDIRINQQSSSSLGEGVKPYKGVKYMTVSKNGIEARC